MPKHNWYHIFGFTNDVRVAAANKHLGLPPRHPHRCTCGRRETEGKPYSAFSLFVLATLHPTHLQTRIPYARLEQTTRAYWCRELNITLMQASG